MSNEMTPEQAQAQIVAEEYAAQNSALVQKVATHRVHAIQLQQENERLQQENERLRQENGSLRIELEERSDL